ncbi:DUF1844 domain-containing protein [Granulicella sp. 5B5]|uniref:DUF1844 domain-containing protein n=1 Tax=Granulicella sp. 5B5 TaxID=1617967 RepID=UPI0015F39FFD|nr:DUF1844 domain-containing protein [Granulicella sp. 5B5]QMV17687.1 DUF1844 domain-containing protein [Granulicella sp. 5B5]
MAEIKQFVVNDRRKFTAEGDVRPDAPPSEPKPARPEASLEPTSDEKFGSSAHLVTPAPEPKGPVAVSDESVESDQPAPPPLTAEQTAEVSRAYDATVDRLDTAIRATNPGMERIPDMTFERVIQSLYMQAMLQLGIMAPPDQKPQVDILGARQTIDMLSILAEKTKGNCTPDETNLMDNALFELRMGFLEMTQALARQAQSKQGPGGVPGMPPVPGSGGPSIVR